MRDEDKSREQLIRELVELRRHNGAMREEDFKQSEELYKQLVELSPDGVAVYSLGKVVFINKIGAKMYGVENPEELVGKPVMDFVHPDYRRMVVERVRKMMEEGKKAPLVEEKFIRYDGTCVDVEVAAAPIAFHGKPAVQVVIRDISDRKRMEEALRLSEECFYKAFNASPNPMAISTFDDGRYLEVNDSFRRIIGYSREEARGFTPIDLDILSPDDLNKGLQTLYGQGILFNFEAYVRTRSGDLRYGLFSADIIQLGSRKYILTVFNDITERKQAEDALRDSEELLRLITDNMLDMVCLTDENLIVQYASPAHYRWLGINPEELTGKSIIDRVHPFDIPAVMAAVKKTLKNKYMGEATFRYRHADGRYLWFESRGKLMLDKDGAVKGGIFATRDITERKKAEEALRSNERFLVNIFESIHDRLSVIDTQFNIIRVNKRVEQTYSHALPLVGKKCYEVYHGQDSICEGCPSVITLKSGQAAHAIIPVKEPGGNITGWLDHYCYPFSDTATGRINGVIVYARDVTEKLQLEQEMARLERLNLVGEMAASIGHEIRNPMTAVRGFLQMLEGKTDCLKYREYFELMIEELDRANSIITEFLSLARNKPVDLKQQNLNSILEVLYPLVQADAINAGKNVVFELGSIPHLLLDEREIRQLILNLVRNGLDAMEPGGKLTIKTFTDGDAAVLSVRDQGNGIKPEVLQKIGTPFLTTKEKGTGLGLAVCYGIAARHNTTIQFETGPGGTTFFVRFKLPENQEVKDMVRPLQIPAGI